MSMTVREKELIEDSIGRNGVAYMINTLRIRTFSLVNRSENL